MKTPTVQEIDASLESMQRIVGGDIEAVYPFDDPVAIVCNEEGKLLSLPMNRALTDESGVPYDIVCGTFFVVGIGDEDFTSLTEQQIEKYRKKLVPWLVSQIVNLFMPHSTRREVRLLTDTARNIWKAKSNSVFRN